MKKIISLGLVVFSLLSAISSLAFGGHKEEIAVAARDRSQGASVSEKAGTSPFFLLFDGKGQFMEVIANPYKAKAGGGEEVAEFLADKGVTIVVAGGFGGPLLISKLPPAGTAAVLPEGSGGPIVEAMKAKGIKAVFFNGSARDGVKAVKGFLKSN